MILLTTVSPAEICVIHRNTMTSSLFAVSGMSLTDQIILMFPTSKPFWLICLIVSVIWGIYSNIFIHLIYMIFEICTKIIVHNRMSNIDDYVMVLGDWTWYEGLLRVSFTRTIKGFGHAWSIYLQTAGYLSVAEQSNAETPFPMAQLRYHRVG